MANGITEMRKRVDRVADEMESDGIKRYDEATRQRVALIMEIVSEDLILPYRVKNWAGGF